MTLNYAKTVLWCSRFKLHRLVAASNLLLLHRRSHHFQKHLECHLWGLIIVARCVYLKMKSHVFCGKTFNFPLLPITHVSRLFALWWLMALHVHRNIYFPSRKLDVSIFSWGVLDEYIPGKNSFLARITGGNMPLFLVLFVVGGFTGNTGQRTGITADIWVCVDDNFIEFLRDAW